MKILIYSDIHWCQDSSIVRSMGEKYSTRLEHLIASLNWAEKLSADRGCDAIINLGDTFDRPNLNSMEITALKDVAWNEDISHFIVVGNHDSDIKSLEYSSSEVFSSRNNFHVIADTAILDAGGRPLLFLPYTIEPRPLAEYLDDPSCIVFSHNDIAGVQLGKYRSEQGFDMEDISRHCALFLNGHIHNMSWVADRILDVGNLCGKTFNEDAGVYPHGVWILDTDTLELEFVENPHALNFYKIAIDGEHSSLASYDLKPNAVLMVSCERRYVDELRKELAARSDVVASKVMVSDVEKREGEAPSVETEKLDYLKMFAEFVESKLGNSDLVVDELSRTLS